MTLLALKTFIPMKIFLLIILLAIPATIFAFTRMGERSKKARSIQSFYDLKMVTLDGTAVDFSEFKGKKVLLVNVASKCGFTPQYAGLQKLYDTYGDRLVIIGFPANDFMKQEPGSNDEIEQFCEANYGITFLMSEKISVKGTEMHEVYRWLTDKNRNGWNSRKPAWNFYKYLVDEHGELTAVFSSRTKPESKKIIAHIEK
jgi:glutathione peroxidase